MKSFSDYLKTSLAVIMVLLSAALCAMRLMKIQVVDSEEYTKQEISVSTYTQKLPAARGQILDADGNTIVTNLVNYSIVIDEKSFPSQNHRSNEILMRIIRILVEDGVSWKDTLPISKQQPYVFASDASEEELLAMKKNIGVNAYATAQNCMDVLMEQYAVAGSYTPEEQRMITGIRYTMVEDEFSMSNQYELASELPMKTVTRISELCFQLEGVSIAQTAKRIIQVGDVLPHEIGMTGPIYAENADEYLEKGYSLDAIVGISGIEYAMEDELQGVEGERTITFEDGIAVADEVTTPAVPGHTVKLTVNSEFQRGLQKILSDFIANFHNIYGGNLNAQGGALVVLDAKTGAVLGEANYPTYDLLDYSEKYDELLETPGNPLYNRATMGLYRPGSTFKTITATAGLNEGIATPDTHYPCNGEYKFIDQTYNCTGNHDYISVTNALRYSCNAYFFELTRQLQLDKLLEYADLFGIGHNTAIETGDSAGFMASPATYKRLGLEWSAGQVLQAGIGNNDINVTPLQLACVANTIANRGVRYEPYLVDSIWDYSTEECLKKTQPTVAARIPEKNDYVFDYVEQGMILASTNNFPAAYSLTNLGYDVAIKTGTPQFASRVQDSAFIGYAPAGNPKIAFAGIVEGGEYSKYMIRSILELYDEVYGMQ